MKTCSMNLCAEVAELTFTFSKLNQHNKGYALAILRSLIFAQENGTIEDTMTKGKKITQKAVKGNNAQNIAT